MVKCSFLNNLVQCTFEPSNSPCNVSPGWFRETWQVNFIEGALHLRRLNGYFFDAERGSESKVDPLPLGYAVSLSSASCNRSELLRSGYAGCIPADIGQAVI